jgi:hypothetical protein
MFKRKKTDVETADGPEIDEAVAETRTTCYPQDAQGPPPVLGQPRTTVYRQAAKWNRGGYDTVN